MEKEIYVQEKVLVMKVCKDQVLVHVTQELLEVCVKVVSIETFMGKIVKKVR